MKVVGFCLFLMGRETDRQTDRQTETERQSEKSSNFFSSSFFLLFFHAKLSDKKLASSPKHTLKDVTTDARP